MAKKLVESKYAQIELNRVNFPTTGAIEAQCKAELAEGQILENGMIVEVDKVNQVVRPTEGQSVDATDGGVKIFGVNYSTEHMYDERAKGLKNFAIGLEDSPHGDFLPRIGLLSVGDLYTTNAIYIDDTDLEKIGKQEVILAPSATEKGYLEVKADTKTLPVFHAVKKTTMPDGQVAVQVQVVKIGM